MINDYFDHVFCINLQRRKDRWQHAVEQAAKCGIQMERFDGTDTLTWGNNGCTLSHRLVLEEIIKRGLKRTLVFEDDFKARFSDTKERFDSMVKEVPDDWDLLYLGGHYAEAPEKRITQHVIKCRRMKTTSSYGVTLEQAKRMVESIGGIGPIDDLFSNWCELANAYIFQPRLFVQYANYSDLQQREMNNEACMEDVSHENSI